MTNLKKLTVFGKEAREEREYWLGKLSADCSTHLLPDRKGPNEYTPPDELVEIQFSSDSVARLAALTGASPFLNYAALITALKICLHKYSGGSVVVIGSPVRRSDVGQQRPNTLAIVTEVAGGSTVKELLTRVRQNLLDAYAKQNYPFEQILAALNVGDGGGRCPLFDVAVVMEGFHLPLPEVKNDITVSFIQTGEQLTGNVRYSSKRFTKESIERLSERFIQVLNQMLDDPSQRVSEINLLTDLERSVLVDWNKTRKDYPNDLCIHQLFELQAECNPDAIAISGEDETLTYRELALRSNQLAHYLRRLGVGPEAVVGVKMHRSAEMIVGILGILKAGGAYLPLDPSHPQERVAYMLKLAQPAVVLTQQHLSETFPSDGQQTLLCLDTDWQLVARESTASPTNTATADNLAYIIFTSGSTGRPKGVAVPHRGLGNCCFAQVDYFHVRSSDHVLQFASLNFDASIFEIIMALCSGAKLFLPRQHSLLVGSTLVDLLRAEQITTATLPPSVVMSMPLNSLPQLRTLIVAGEACGEELVERWAGGREFFNLYGPTEATIWATGARCEKNGGEPAIGKPISNVRIHVLNHEQRPAPIGVAGEIYIGGAGVARGYLNQSELSAERFIPDEFSGEGGARLYRTGDLGRYNANGEIEFLGRVDEQIKLRGFRIELGEIESVLRQQTGVAAAVVVVKSDGVEGEQLVAYVVGADGLTPDANSLRAGLREKLPEYMLPDAFVPLDKIPLTINGKLDKRALPAIPRAIAVSATEDKELTAVEEILANTWAAILNLEQVKLTDNFLELGGHSLLATQVMTRVNEAFGIDLSLRVIFESPTLQELAERVEAELKANRSLPANPIEKVSREDHLSLSFAQQRLLFLDQLEPGNSLYNSPIARRLRGVLNVEALAQSFSEVIRRHEVLRTSFPIHSGQPVQEIAAAKPLELIVTDLSNLAPEEREIEAHRQAAAEARQPFDLENGPVFRIRLLKLAEEEHLLLMTLHHIVNDAWSLSLLFRELSLLYNAFSENRSSPLAELPVQYADYAAWQREYLQGEMFAEQLSYWKEQLSGAPVLLQLPTDRPRPPVQSYKGAAESFRLPPELSQQIAELSRREGVTLFMTLLAAFQILLARYTGQEDVVVGSPIAGRTRKETERLIGLFMNTLALRARITPQQTFREVLAGVRETCLGAYAHQEIPFERLVEELRPERSLSHQPLFQVLFQFVRLGRDSVRFAGLKQEGFKGKTEKAKFDLTLMMIEDANGLGGVLEYNTELFEPATATRFVSHLINLLTAVGSAPDIPIAFLPLISDDERHQLLSEWNDTGINHSRELSVQQLFEQQVERTPDAVALICAAQKVSYAELNERANQLAHYLRSLGVGPESLVAILTGRSVEMVVCLLATLKAGGGYVPLSQDYPVERLRLMVEDSGSTWLLTDSEIPPELAQTNVRLVHLAAASAHVQKESKENPSASVWPRSLAYVIYTSGSTGQPKGVMIEHASLSNFLQAMQGEPGISSHDVLVALTPLSFDIAALELFLPLISGASVVIVERAIAADAASLLALLEEANATLMQATPSTWQMLVEEDWKGSAQLKALCGGEALNEELARALTDRTGELWNMYGPTETTIWSTVARVEKNAAVMIGRGIANTRVYVLDGRLEPVPVGVLGDLYIGGEGLARGYLGKAGLTAECFVPDGLSGNSGGRLYRTGDIAKWSASGQLEYCGRADSQVKLRGHRIELGEIESALLSHQSVREVAVVMLGSASEARLVAYVVAEAGAAIDSAELRSYLRERLPEYMVPAGVVELSALPLTPHGKLDRRALSLRKAQYSQLPAVVIAPRSEIEEKLALLWQELLQVEAVSVDSNFFDLGGHSLLLIRLAHELRELFPVELQLVDLFKHPTIELLAAFLSRQLTGGEPTPPNRLQAPVPVAAGVSFANDSIAIIGLSGRFPGAADIQQYWENLREGRETISRFSDEELEAAGVNAALLADPSYVKASGILDDIDLFDAQFFGFSAKEAEIMDPQQRLFMECAWQALESAGYDAERYGGRIGVYAGQSMSTYLLRLLRNSKLVRSVGEFPLLIGNREDFLATRTCYKLNLRGPGVVIQSACSTSLVAIVMACRSLLDGESDIALAGGVSINLLDKAGYYYHPEGIVSPDGHCRAFDQRAQGSVGGNGLGVVVLKRLSAALADGDMIHAVIRGAAINNDGALKMGYTAPSVEGQAEVIAMAQSLAGVDPETISYVEAHGTGTALGDPIEIAALTQAFRARTDRNGFCAIGSVKTNIGHLDAAAGVAGLIKTVLALKHEQLPPSLHFENPNPQIHFADSPFYVNSKLAEWPRANGTPRRAAISSFGIGGTNAHVILEEEPSLPAGSESRARQLIVLSARSHAALEHATQNLSQFLRTNPDSSLADVAHTLQVGRKIFSHRRMLVCRDLDEAVSALDGRAPDRVFTAQNESRQRPVAFMFPGQGTQYVGMGRQLYDTEPVFRKHLDTCSQLLEAQLGFDLRELLYPAGTAETEAAATRLRQTAIAQPALFAVEYSLAQLWMSWGVRPAALIGHSIGEYVAACIAGVFSLEDALRLVAVRGRLMQQMPAGTMLVVPLPESEVRALLNSRLSLASVNTPSLCVVAGAEADVLELEHRLEARAVASTRLHTSHAFHSWMMDAALQSFRGEVEKITLHVPQIPFVSNLTGIWITAADATEPDYWVRQLRETVRLSDGLLELFKETNLALVEVGPGRSLTNIARLHPGRQAQQVAVPSLPHIQERIDNLNFMLESVGKLWLAGVAIDWKGFSAGERRRRVDLPTYPFERERYWIESTRKPRQSMQAPVAEANGNGKPRSESLIPETIAPQPVEPASGFHQRPALSSQYEGPTNDLEKAIVELWEELLGVNGLGIHDNFFELGGHSLLGTTLLTRLRKMFQVELALRTLFEAPTVAELALAIEETLINEIGNFADSEYPRPAVEYVQPV
jgi:amino acid adenylation domain-containing protein